jgi:hypothetical protein
MLFHFSHGGNMFARRSASLHFVLAALISICIAASARAVDFRIGSWNFANNPDDATEDGYVRTVIQAIGNENNGGRVKRLDLLGAVETDSTSATRVTNIFNSLYGTSSYRQITSPADGGGDRAAFFYDSSTLTLNGSTSLDIGTHYALRAQFTTVATGRVFYAYAVHLKSGGTAADKTARANEAAALRSNTNTLPNSNLVVMGDFNWYGISEGAWSNLTGSGGGRVLDSANQLGEWHDNSAFRRWHSQDTAVMDDRFDMQLISDEVQNGAGFDIYPGSFRAFANNGTHTFNGAISTGTGASAAVLNALVAISDHLPVVADYHTPEPGVVMAGFGLIVVFARRVRGKRGEDRGESGARAVG